MNSIFEMAITLNQYNEGKIDPTSAASVIVANLASLDSVETSEIRRLAQSVGFSLADIEWVGDDSELEKKLGQLRYHLNRLADEKTSVVNVPARLRSSER